MYSWRVPDQIKGELTFKPILSPGPFEVTTETTVWPTPSR